MGGRSREREDDVGFGFVSELTDSRLSAYGQYSSVAYQNLDSGTITKHGVPQNHGPFNAALAEEYKNRFGVYPNWDLKQNAKAETNRRKNLGFKDE